MTNDKSTAVRSFRPPRIRWKWAVASIALLAGALGYWAFQTPSGLYWRAKRLAKSDPETAEQLVMESVGLADGNYPPAQLLWCRLLAKSGRWTEALGAFSQIQDGSACDQAELLELAKQALAARQNLMAQYALMAADRPGPARIQVLEMLISLKLEGRQSSDAIALAKKLSRQSPESVLAWLVISQVALEQKDLKEALVAGRRGLKCHPSPQDEAALRNILVQVLMDTGDMAAARQEMDRLLAAGPPTDAVHIKHAFLLRYEGRTNDAMKEINQVLDHAPGSNRARMVRGMLLFDQGAFQAALADFTAVVDADPYNKEAHYKFAQSASRLGKSELANRHLEISNRLTTATVKVMETEAEVARDPRNPERLRELANLYDQLGRFQQAATLRRHLETVTIR